MDVLAPDRNTEVSLTPDSPSHSSLLKREMPGLDALRGIAVLSVFAYHGLHWWLSPALSYSPGVLFLASVTTAGWLGVNLFFVLSGFLITGILIDSRHKQNYWSSFYSRRALRILPLYLVVLIILRLYDGADFRYLLLCLLYLGNFAVARKGVTYGPLWSLAVEEQFYLIWPFLVRKLKLRSLAIACMVSLALSPLLRYLAMRGLPLGDIHSATWLLTDNLAAGALIAVLLRGPAATRARVRGATVALGATGIVLLAVGFSCHLLNRITPAGAAFQQEPFLCLFAAMLLLALQYGDRPAVLRFSAPLRFYGYISYGLYLIHSLAFRRYQDLFDDAHPIPAQLTLASDLLRFFGVLAVVTLLCFISRRTFEQFFLRLKDRLAPYTAPRPAVPPSA